MSLTHTRTSYSFRLEILKMLDELKLSFEGHSLDTYDWKKVQTDVQNLVLNKSKKQTIIMDHNGQCFHS